MQNSETPKWIAIIVVIFLTIVGGMFAWTQGQISHNTEEIMETREILADMRAYIRHIREHIGER